MEFWITIGRLLQRKWVVIPAVLVAFALGALAYLGTPKTYVSSTTMVLTTTEYGGTQSRDPAAPTALTNPLLNFNDSLRTTSAILIQTMTTKDVAAELGARPPTKLVVDDGRSNPQLLGLNGPFLFVLVQSTSPDEAARIVVEAQKLMRQKLKQWQDSLGAPKTTFVGLVDVVPPSAPEADRGRAIKLGLMASIFGFVLSLGVAYFRHQRRTRRQARVAAAQAVADTTPPPRGGPEGGRVRRRSRSPVLRPEGDEEDAEPGVVPTPLEKQPEPAAVPATVEKRPEPAAVPATVEKRPEPAAARTRQRKAQPAVVPAPVKKKVRSRNP
jgi:hypothetical protein